MNGFIQHIRFALRQLRKSPGFAIVAVLTIGLGIGATPAIFSLINGILVTPLPYSDPEQLVSVRAIYPAGALAAVREQIHTRIGGYREGHEFNLVWHGDPVRASYVPARRAMSADPLIALRYDLHIDMT